VKFFDKPETALNLAQNQIVDPKAQYHFLKSYMVKKAPEIREAFEKAQMSTEYKAATVPYRRMILILISRMCELEPKAVHLWVSLDYFPADDCREICLVKRNLLG
jgi:hypothetical protein